MYILKCIFEDSDAHSQSIDRQNLNTLYWTISLPNSPRYVTQHFHSVVSISP